MVLFTHRPPQYQRAPFIGVSDFVNRRLTTGSRSLGHANSYGGVIQTALDLTRAVNDNGSRNNDLLMPRLETAANLNYGAPYWGDPIETPEPQKYETFQLRSGGNPRAKGGGAASQITQADVLQQLGPVLVTRGDTFVIRSYGDSHDASGRTLAVAWCEAVVLSTPVPIQPDPSVNGLNPKIGADKPDWGRRFEIQSFR